MQQKQRLLKDWAYYLGVLCILFGLGLPVRAQSNRQYLKDFKIRSSTMVQGDGPEVSSVDFPTDSWYKATVPTTVLYALVQDGVYPDPYVGVNNMKIPDANDKVNEKYDLLKYSHLPNHQNPWSSPYWYRTEFKVDKSEEGKQIWIHFNGINYRADVWINGNKVADADHMVGMFGKFRYNVTDAIKPGDTNVMAVKIHPLDYPGMPGEPQLKALGPFGVNGGPTGDIGKNVTMHASVGWDWLPAIRDRNMGIWQDVYLETSGDVDLAHPHIVTDLPLPDTSRAELSVDVEIRNMKSKPVVGKLNIHVSPANFHGETVTVSRQVTLRPKQYKKIYLKSSQYAGLSLHNPHLWWPNTYGQQNLYNLKVDFEVDGKKLDEAATRFGVREIGTKSAVFNDWYRRDFFINGERIQIKGGAWVPDMMLHRSDKKLYAELRLSKDANLNMVRIWGGGVTPPDNFFKYCDEMGLLVWHDFWITGDAQGTFGKGSRDWPFDRQAFLQNARSTVKQIRNHPSLLVWTGGNEAYPRKNIYDPLRNQILQGLDGTRPFLPTSGYANPPKPWDLSYPDNHPSGAYSGGPYMWVPPEKYYEFVKRGRDWVFKDEVGIPSLPPAESIKKFIPNITPDPDEPYPLNDTWGYHDAAEGNGKFSVYDSTIRARYGEPQSLEQYTEEGQLVNANSYRAMFEATSHSLDRTGGVILWKTNPAWPSVIWQIYDWYLRPNAGYYYIKKASEPLHVMLTLDTKQVAVINDQFHAENGLQVSAAAYDMGMNKIFDKQQSTDIDSLDSKNVFKLDIPGNKSDEIYFVKLKLTDASGKLRSDNFYWMHDNTNFTGLRDLPDVQLNIDSDLHKDGDEWVATVYVKNPTDHLAFFINPEIRKGQDGGELLPTYWSDNYFNLLPGESRTVKVRWKDGELDGKNPVLKIGGYNIKSTQSGITR